jgi:hypothetical protein
MTSQRQIAANRRNAQASRGARTPPGRRRVSNNALSHGLAVSVLKDPALSSEVERLAHALAGADADGALLMQARRFVEAEFEFQRVTRLKIFLINAQLEKLRASFVPLATHAADEQSGKSPRPQQESDKSFAVGRAIVNILPQLLKMQRYERRARSRQARAYRLIIAHTAAAAAGRIG